MFLSLNDARILIFIATVCTVVVIIFEAVSVIYIQQYYKLEGHIISFDNFGKLHQFSKHGNLCVLYNFTVAERIR